MSHSRLMVTAVAALALFGCAMQAERKPEITTFNSQPKEAVFKSAAVFNFPLQGTAKGEGAFLGDLAAEALLREKVAVNATRLDRNVYDPAEASQLAREKYLDTAIYGSIEALTYGGLTTESKATVTLVAVDAATAKVLWKIQGTLAQPPIPPSDKYFYVDGGKPAPMPIVLAKKIIDEMALVLAGRPTPKVVPFESYGTDPTATQPMSPPKAGVAGKKNR